MRQVLRAGVLGRLRGMGWGGRREGGSGWGIRVNPWLIHVNVWQKTLQYSKVISLWRIKINEQKKKDTQINTEAMPYWSRDAEAEITMETQAQVGIPELELKTCRSLSVDTGES